MMMNLIAIALLGVCPLTKPVITDVVANNYFTKASWPAIVSARGPRPFVLEQDELPMFWSSFDNFTAPIDNGDLSRWSLSQRVDDDGCYHATWGATAIPDAPFSPLWCAGGWPAFCGTRTGETMRVQVCDSEENMVIQEFSCEQTTRGSKCVGH